MHASVVEPRAVAEPSYHPAEASTAPAGAPLTFQTLAERADLGPVIQAVDATAYPAFMRYSDLAAWWPAVFAAFPEYQLILVDSRTGEHQAHGNLLPFAWDGSSDDLPTSAVAMVGRALDDRRRGKHPTVLGALQAVVDPRKQGGGLSVQMLKGMAGLAALHRIPDLVAPIRPTEKALNPLMPLAEYVKRTRADGLPVDPWQRVHARLGAEPVGVREAWLTVCGSLEEWVRWTQTRIPTSGPYLVPGALAPIQIDAAYGIGHYVEPHLWMRYRIS